MTTKISCILLLGFLTFISCAKQKEKNALETTKADEKFQKLDTLNIVLDQAEVDGSILIYDPKKDRYFSNDFEWAKTGQLPASTFKIPNSIIALESGVVENDSTLFIWDGEKRRFKSWEQDLNLQQAFQFSCVPCYQEVARKVGVEQMRSRLDTLNYHKMVFDSTTIDNFWLQGASRINQFEQIDFLQRFYQSELPISKRTETIVKRIMRISENKDYTLYGKTGWSITNTIDNGWFVGYIEKGDAVYYFATNLTPHPEVDDKTFLKLRKDLTLAALKLILLKN